MELNFQTLEIEYTLALAHILVRKVIGFNQAAATISFENN